MHEGHRSRLKRRFLEHGASTLMPHEALELLLFYSIPRRDTNEIAHSLITQFGSLSGIFQAPYDALLHVNGLGSASALLIKLILPLSQKIAKDNLEISGKITMRQLGLAMCNKFIGCSVEHICIAFLDSKMRLIFCDLISEGGIFEAKICISKIIKLAVKKNAVFAAFAHNHPSGSRLPSRQDIEATKALRNALNVVDVHLLDHFIIAGDEFVSLADTDLREELFGV